MKHPDQIPERAMSAAGDFLRSAVDEIAAMADGDLNALYEAAQIVRTRAAEPVSEHAAEHLAFSLITAAHNQLRTGQAPREP